MEKVWYTINLGTIPADEPHYVIGDFNCALFTVTEMDYEPVKWTE